MNTGARESLYIEINGIKQYISIFAKDPDAPIILNLHGGPANPDSFLMYELAEQLANDFTLVCWDQRGCGRTYYENKRIDPDNNTVSFEQALADADSLVDYLRCRFAQEKIIIMGHSYGSILGVKYAYRNPEKVLHYIGIGQSVSLMETQKRNYGEILQLPGIKPKAAKKLSEAYRAMLEQADIESVARLQRLTLPEFQKQCKGVRQSNQLKLLFCSPCVSFRDFRWLLGMLNIKKHLARNRKLMEYIVALDIRENELDKHCNVELVQEYCQKINAKSKRVVVLDNHGHSPHIAEPSLVANEIIRAVNENRSRSEK